MASGARLLPVILLVLLLQSSCSLVLDLPADCRPEDCSGFQCNAEGTGCLADCVVDDECVDGFVCDDARCVDTGCAADGDLKTLLPIEATADVALFFNGAELAAVWKDASGLLFQRFDKQSNPLDEPLGLDPPGNVPGRPSLVWTGDVWAVAWEAAIRNNDGDLQEVLRFAVIGVGDRFDVEPKTLWVALEDRMTGRIEKSVDSPSLVWDEVRERFAVAWTTRIIASDVYLMILNKDGTDLEGEEEIPHEAGRQVSLTDEDSVEPKIIVRGQDVYDVVYREGAAQVNVLLRTVSLDGVRQGNDVNVSETTARSVSHGYVAITSGSVIAFTEQDGEVGLTYRAQIKRDREIAGEAKLQIDRGFTNTSDATAASFLSGEYAAFFVAERNRRNEVYMARFKDNGARIGAAFSLTEDLSRLPSKPVVAATDNGYYVLHQENEGPDAGTVKGRHWTCAPAD